MLGLTVGASLGLALGLATGDADGLADGLALGLVLGLTLGEPVGVAAPPAENSFHPSPAQPSNFPPWYRMAPAGPLESHVAELSPIRTLPSTMAWPAT